jgi:hypothetical protein
MLGDRSSLQSALRELRQQRMPSAFSKIGLTSDDVQRVHVPFFMRCSHSSPTSSTKSSKGDWHFSRRTLCSSKGAQFCGVGGHNDDDSSSDSGSCISRRVMTKAEVDKVAERLYNTQLRPALVPKPPPCIGASEARRKDFSARHVRSAPPRRSIPDEEYSQHFFVDAQRHKMEKEAGRQDRDALAHDKMHHIIDKGVKLDASDTDLLVKRLKDDTILQKEQEHLKLTEKYVDRIRKRGCPQPSGRRRRQHRDGLPKSDRIHKNKLIGSDENAVPAEEVS